MTSSNIHNLIGSLYEASHAESDDATDLGLSSVWYRIGYSDGVVKNDMTRDASVFGEAYKMGYIDGEGDLERLENGT